MAETTITVNSDEAETVDELETQVEAIETVVDASVEIAQIEADTVIELAEINAEKEITLAAIEADNNPQESDLECQTIHHLQQTVETLQTQVLNLEQQLVSLQATTVPIMETDLTPQFISPETSETPMEVSEESESESLIVPLVEVEKQRTFRLV